MMSIELIYKLAQIGEKMGRDICAGINSLIKIVLTNSNL